MQTKLESNVNIHKSDDYFSKTLIHDHLSLDFDNAVSLSELLTGGVKNDSRFEAIDNLPWALDVDPFEFAH